MAWMKRIMTVAVVLGCGAWQAQAALVIKNLLVEYRSQPLGIDVQQPRFSWQMEATAGERGVAQAAYAIEVRDPTGAIVWDSKKTGSPEALHIKYARERVEGRHSVRVDGDGVDAGGREARAPPPGSRPG